MFHKKIHGFAGMTLIEVMIAMVIFIVGILALLGLQGVTMVNNDRSRGDMAARAMALSRLDHLQRLTANAFTNGDLQPCTPAWGTIANVWCHVDTGAAGSYPAGSYNAAGNPPSAASTLNEQGIVVPSTAGAARYRRYWHVQPASTGFPNSVEVRMRVDWTELNIAGSSGLTHSLTYETMLVF